MLVIISIRRLDNDRIEIGVARPQHDSNPTHNYPSEKEVRAVLLDFGITCTLQRKVFENVPVGFDGTLSPVRFEDKTCGTAAIFTDSCSTTD